MLFSCLSDVHLLYAFKCTFTFSSTFSLLEIFFFKIFSNLRTAIPMSALLTTIFLMSTQHHPIEIEHSHV